MQRRAGVPNHAGPNHALPNHAGPGHAGPGPAEAGPTTVGIVEGESLARLGLRSIVENSAETTLVGEAMDANGMVDLALRQRPSTLVVDVGDSPMEMLAAVAALRSRLPGTHVLALTATPSDDLVFRALSAGVTGVLLKDCDPRELLDGIRAVAAGEAVLSASVTRRLVNWFRGADVDSARVAHDLVQGLTGRESEVLASVAKGMGNLEIARKLYMSEGAVKAHISRLLTKLRCANRVQAAMVYHYASLPH